MGDRMDSVRAARREGNAREGAVYFRVRALTGESAAR